MTPLLPHCSLEQARGSWNSEEAWAVISVGREPTLGSLLSLNFSLWMDCWKKGLGDG
jgi:hypothetical protein